MAGCPKQGTHRCRGGMRQRFLPCRRAHSLSRPGKKKTFVPVLRAVALFCRDVQLAHLTERHAQATLHACALRCAVLTAL